ncbi:MAG: hypothetical protein IT222_02345 [Crocinitomix sp.]|nr:hypothetical protein [Crocinitomix sp.]
MRIKLYLLSTVLLGLFSLSQDQVNKTEINKVADEIVKIEMDLSAFGVEADHIPSIHAVIDFVEDSSFCSKSFYNPAYENSTYTLTKSEMTSILKLLIIDDLKKLKSTYTVNFTDQPRSTTKIYTTQNTFVFDDYGLVGDYPLKDLYKIVYKY